MGECFSFNIDHPLLVLHRASTLTEIQSLDKVIIVCSVCSYLHALSSITEHSSVKYTDTY